MGSSASVAVHRDDLLHSGGVLRLSLAVWHLGGEPQAVSVWASPRVCWPAVGGNAFTCVSCTMLASCDLAFNCAWTGDVFLWLYGLPRQLGVSTHSVCLDLVEVSLRASCHRAALFEFSTLLRASTLGITIPAAQDIAALW
eukprot:TRINITY_DN5333_c0_g2_i1.p2 TRINITY_DN5333_c0_g2~~TRINITY_DN5333_c0_g2_i1.p2  ORF type:complete len:141 (-),score=1.74 TRINITY_DN5333_c0_g2_i1:1212-1634(-)